MRQRFITFAVFGLILVTIGEWNLRTRKIAPLATLDETWLEFCIGNAGESLSDPAVTVIRITDDYEPLNIGQDEPAAVDNKLSRLDFATILGFVGKLEPKSVAFLPTPNFDETLILNQTDIVPLKDAAMQLPRFLGAANVTSESTSKAQQTPLNYQPIKVEGDSSALITFTRTLRYPDPQILANANPSFKTIESTSGLTSESEIRVPLVANHEGEVVPSIALAAVANHAGIALEQITLNLSGSSPVIQLGELQSIPLEADGTFILPPSAGLNREIKSRRKNESGEMQEVYHLTSLTVDELAYTGEADDDIAKRILADFQGKFDSLNNNLVVIGFDRNKDRRFTTAYGEVLSETNILARTMATIQSGRFIDQWSLVCRVIGVIAIGAIALVLFRFRKRKFIPLCFVAALIYFSVTVMIFRSTLSWTSPFSAFALFGLMFLIGLVISGGSDGDKPVESESA